MYIDKLDGTITSAYYDRRAAEFRADQDRIQTVLTDHQRANQSYLDSGIRLLDLASQAAARSAWHNRRCVEGVGSDAARGIPGPGGFSLRLTAVPTRRS
jgi:hypothetical protein